MKPARPDARGAVLARVLVLTTFALALAPVAVAADKGLVLIGYSANYLGGMPVGSGGSLKADEFCGQGGVSAMLNAQQAVLDRLAGRIAGFAPPPAGDLERAAGAAQKQLCQGDRGFQVDPNVITYSACRLTVDQQAILMDLRVPAGDTPGAMDIVDFWKAEITRIPLYRSAGGAAAANAAEWDAAVNWTGPRDARQLAGHSATRWDFQYATTMAIAGAGMKINMSTKGYGYFSRNVPGFGILEEFYDRFASGISFEQGGGSFFGGLMSTWVDVLARGVPLEMDQTVTSSSGAMGMGGSSRSFLKVSSLQLADLPADFCSVALAPDYFEVSDAGQGLAAMSASPGGSGAGAAPQAQEGMSSLGSLMEMINSMGQQGAAAAGGQQAPAADPAGQPAARAASATPSSAELTTSNLTQSVQQHLQALGYDTGNANGELSTDTVIAISQFQAEKGLRVTGEVTPQLLGILGAEVDARR